MVIKRAYVQLLLRKGDGREEERKRGKKWERKKEQAKVGTYFCPARFCVFCAFLQGFGGRMDTDPVSLFICGHLNSYAVPE